MITVEDNLPDLLHRFVSTPYQVRTTISGIDVILQTNDLDIVSEMQKARTSYANGGYGPFLSAKIIKDYVASGVGTDTILLSAWPLVTILVGTATMITLDCDRREVLGFIASSVSAERFVHELFSMLLNNFCAPSE